MGLGVLMLPIEWLGESDASYIVYSGNEVVDALVNGSGWGSRAAVGY